MRATWPGSGEPHDVDPVELVAADHRPPPDDRPWVVVNMIASVDGASTDADGLSGGLGGRADKEMFRAVRAVADVVVAGARTVVAEDYGPARTPPRLQDARAARGQRARPRIAVVTRSLDISPSQRLFGDPEDPPLVLTGAGRDPARLAALAAVGEVVEVGDDPSGGVDWRRALALLRDQGHRVALVEGGPSTNAQLVAEDLVDEVLVTISPSLVGGTAPRIVEGPRTHDRRRLRLDRVLEDDGFVFLRYLRERSQAP